jgi:hypothetical protein
MIIGLEGFGSIWSVRARSKQACAFYNTTGIVTDGKLRHRSRVFGQLRFNEAGGFNPNLIEGNIGRVFESSGPLLKDGRVFCCITFQRDRRHQTTTSSP